MDPRFFRKYADLITEAQTNPTGRSAQIWDYFEKAATGYGSSQDIVGNICQKFDITIDDLDSIGREYGVDNVYEYIRDAKDFDSDQPRPTYDALPHPSDQLYELSQDTLGSYVKKANQDREQSYSSAKNRYDIGDSDAVVKANQQMQKRQDGINTAYGKMNKKVAEAGDYTDMKDSKGQQITKDHSNWEKSCAGKERSLNRFLDKNAPDVSDEYKEKYAAHKRAIRTAK